MQYQGKYTILDRGISHFLHLCLVFVLLLLGGRHLSHYSDEVKCYQIIVRFLAGAVISLLSTASRPALGLTLFPNLCILGALSSAVKQLWRGANHSPPFEG